MTSKEVLKQEEVDALLQGVKSGDVPTGGDHPPAAGEVRGYDPANQGRTVRVRMHALEALNERFARFFRDSLFNLLHRTAEISVHEIKTQRFSDYINELFTPASLNITKIKPLRGTALIALDSKLVFTVVDNFFGGDGKPNADSDGREFTQAELRVVQTILRHAYRDLQEAWQPVTKVEFEHVKSEVNPQLANIVNPSEVVVVTSFHIELEKGGGDLHVTMPYSMIEPIRGLFMSGMPSEVPVHDDRWTLGLREEMKAAKVRLACTLVETEITLREMMNLNAGDVIPVDLEEHVVAKVEGVPVFKCQYGVSRGSNAVKLVEKVRRTTSSNR